MTNARACASLLCVPLLGCLISRDERPGVELGAEAATHYIHRGMPQNERGVLQPRMTLGLPATVGGDFDVTAWGNLDLQDETGDAWFPDDNGGRFSEIDFTFAYSNRVGPLDVTGGIVNYNLMNGSEFATRAAGSARGPTTEAFVTATGEVLGVSPFGEIHYDLDEVEDFYLRGGVSKGFAVSGPLRADLRAHLGWSGEDESLWNYGLAESGFADVVASGALSYPWDENTTIRLTVAGSRIVDRQLKDWFDLLGIERNNVWASIGVVWNF